MTAAARVCPDHFPPLESWESLDGKSRRTFDEYLTRALQTQSAKRTQITASVMQLTAYSAKR